MELSVELYRIYGFGNLSDPELASKRDTLVDYTWKAIEEWDYEGLQQILSRKEFLGFLPMQRFYREAGKGDIAIRNLGIPAFTSRCISKGVHKLNQYRDVDLLPGEIEIFDKTPDGSLDERLAEYDFSEDEPILQSPPAEVLTKTQFKKRMSFIENQRYAKNQMGKYLEAIANQGLIIESDIREHGKDKWPNRKSNQIAKKIKESQDRREKRLRMSAAKITEPKITAIQETERYITPHTTTRLMLRNYSEWLRDFTLPKRKPGDLNERPQYNTRLAGHFIQGFVDLYEAESNALEVFETMPYSSVIPLIASISFFKNYAPQMFEETTQLSSEEFFEFHAKINPYTSYFTSPFIRKMKSKLKIESELQTGHIDIDFSFNPKDFLVPRQPIISKTKAKEFNLVGQVPTVTFYPTKNKQLEELGIDKEEIQEKRKKKKRPPVTEEQQNIIKRQMVNGVREHIRDKLRVKEMVI